MASKQPANSQNHPVSKAQAKKEVSTNNYIALMALITIAVVIAGGYFSFLLIKENIRNTKVIAGKYKAQRDLDQKLQDAQSVVSNYNSLSQQDKQLISSAMPTSADYPQVINLLENAGNAAGVRIKGVTVGGESGSSSTAGQAVGTSGVNGNAAPSQSASAGSGLQKTVFTVDIDGNYTNLGKFLQNVELSARPLNTLSMEVKGSSSSLSGTLTIQTYYQPKADISDKTEVVK